MELLSEYFFMEIRVFRESIVVLRNGVHKWKSILKSKHLFLSQTPPARPNPTHLPYVLVRPYTLMLLCNVP